MIHHTTIHFTTPQYTLQSLATPLNPTQYHPNSSFFQSSPRTCRRTSPARGGSPHCLHLACAGRVVGCSARPSRTNRRSIDSIFAKSVATVRANARSRAVEVWVARPCLRVAWAVADRFERLRGSAVKGGGGIGVYRTDTGEGSGCLRLQQVLFARRTRSGGACACARVLVCAHAPIARRPKEGFAIHKPTLLCIDGRRELV